MNIELLLAQVIPPSDREHRDGFDNTPIIEKLSSQEKQELEDALINELSQQTKPDTLIAETLAYLKSTKSLPLLNSFLETPLYEISKLIIATSIYEISQDKTMIDVAINCLKKIDDPQDPYYTSILISAFYYLIKFKNQKINSLIQKYTTHKEYLISYNAKRYLGL